MKIAYINRNPISEEQKEFLQVEEYGSNTYEWLNNVSFKSENDVKDFCKSLKEQKFDAIVQSLPLAFEKVISDNFDGKLFKPVTERIFNEAGEKVFKLNGFEQIKNIEYKTERVDYSNKDALDVAVFSRHELTDKQKVDFPEGSTFKQYDINITKDNIDSVLLLAKSNDVAVVTIPDELLSDFNTITDKTDVLKAVGSYNPEIKGFDHSHFEKITECKYEFDKIERPLDNFEINRIELKDFLDEMKYEYKESKYDENYKPSFLICENKRDIKIIVNGDNTFTVDELTGINYDYEHFLPTDDIPFECIADTELEKRGFEIDLKETGSLLNEIFKKTENKIENNEKDSDKLNDKPIEDSDKEDNFKDSWEFNDSIE